MTEVMIMSGLISIIEYKGITVKHKRLGFTIVEMLTVLAIIAILVVLLIPSLNMVRNITKQTQQKAQMAAIDMALTAFRSDYGDYPPSAERDEDNQRYCGAQKLAEALLGKDLLGFHPDSHFRNDGEDGSGNDLYYPAPTDTDNLKARKGLYLNSTDNAFKLGDLFGRTKTSPLDPNTFVICDVFGVKKLASGDRMIKAGTPILYYRANTANKSMTAALPQDRIYNSRDNLDLIQLRVLPDLSDNHKLAENLGRYFYDPKYGIIDPKVNIKWPHRPDSYILISAGADGEYGTSDDIFNF